MFGFSSKGRQVMSSRIASLDSSARLVAARARRRSPMKHHGQIKSEVIETGILVAGRVTETRAHLPDGPKSPPPPPLLGSSDAYGRHVPAAPQNCGSMWR